MLPRLKAAGWDCLTLRVYADPTGQLRQALLARKDLFAKEPAKSTTLRILLERASQERTRAGLPPLLVVIDQFEEFLILNDAAARAPLIELLHALDKSPLPGLRLLCVFRSDYRELLFKLGLPTYLPGGNAFELAPFLRPEAEAFLRKGGRVLSPGATMRFSPASIASRRRAATTARSRSTWSASSSSACPAVSPAAPSG